MLALAIAVDRFRMNFMIIRRLIRPVLTFAFGVSTWLASQEPAAAQLLVAQTGSTKTAIGWLIVLLCIGLGLLVVCRPNGRKSPLKR